MVEGEEFPLSCGRFFIHTRFFTPPHGGREREMVVRHLRDEESEAPGTSKTLLRGTPLEMGCVQADPQVCHPPPQSFECWQVREERFSWDPVGGKVVSF